MLFSSRMADDGSGGLSRSPSVLLCTLICVCFCMFCSVVDDDDDDIEYILKQLVVLVDKCTHTT